MKTIVMFKSDTFDLSWPKDENRLNEIPWGEDCATYLMKELAVRDIKCEDQAPIDGEHGWAIYPRIGQRTFSVFVQWVPIGRPSEDYWVIQVRTIQGCLATLFLRPKASIDLGALCEHLSKILESEKGAKKIAWLTTEEYRQLVLRGKIVKRRRE